MNGPLTARINGYLRYADWQLIVCTAALLGWGLVMVASASVAVSERITGELFHYFYRQSVYALIGVVIATGVFMVPLRTWEHSGFMLMAFALFLLVLVLIPGIGHEVNGARRWIDLGPVNLQASEPARLCFLIYLAGYVVRRIENIRNRFSGMLKPMALTALFCVLVLLEPDFGAAAILTGVTALLLFTAGARISHLLLVGIAALGSLAILLVTSPYRVARVLSFSDPWAQPFDGGFQLTQALIAIGRGEWFGVGLGNSVQKLLYLPETHTDFLYAVIAEEFGLFGSTILLALFGWLLWRGAGIARQAFRSKQYFGGYLAMALTSWLGLQAAVNIAVNTGLLPTKGLTLPLMSYGGSSLVTSCVAIGILLRIHHESAAAQADRPRRERA